MSAHMIINTESIVGYNNDLKRAKPGMKLGVNNDVNTSTKNKSRGASNIDGEESKVNPPNSQASNPVHAAATTKSSQKIK